MVNRGSVAGPTKQHESHAVNMSLLQRFKRRRSRPAVIVECRRCGTTVEPETTTCPTCSASDIARYEL
jgi:uncharacterized OB-fold protein